MCMFYLFPFWKRFVPLGMNLRELLNIQKRERPHLGPSFTNLWPRPLPHLPHLTCKRWHTVIYQSLIFYSNLSLNALYLISAPSLLMFGHTVLMDGFCEGWPWWWMLIFRLAGKQLVSTFCTNIYAYRRTNLIITIVKTSLWWIPLKSGWPAHNLLHTLNRIDLFTKVHIGVSLPVSKWSLKISPPENEQKDMTTRLKRSQLLHEQVF